VDLSVQALILGLVQGLTEFIPVSSSGHLILVPAAMGWTDPFIDSLLFSVVLHMGTLVALLVYFWRDWATLIPAGLASIRDRSLMDDPDRKVAWLLVIATIPAVIIGPLFNDAVENAIRKPAEVAVMLCVGAAILWLADRWGTKVRPMESLTFKGALYIGIGQVLSLFPGISRSGVTVAMGLFEGLDREAATRFAFLMATPIVAGTGVWEARKLIGQPDLLDQSRLMAIGFVAAAASGIIAIHFVLQYVKHRPLTLFVVYRVALAAAVFFLLDSPHGA
jgi:undecaprenyl-diphosphatase